MIKRKYRKKIKREYKRKYKRGRGVGDRFKFLYSLGKQWHNSMQWGAKKLCDGKTECTQKGNFAKW